MNGTNAVLFVSFGGPDKREDVRPFLESVTRGRGIPPERIEEVARHYEAIGGASPINAITNRQAEGLREQLNGTPVYVGNRNWHPFLEVTLREMAAAGIKQAVGFPTAAYRCEASWERYLQAVEAARKKVGPSAPAVTYVGPWFDHPLFIDAIVARIREAHAPANASWIFTAHSIPTPMAEASRYVQELEATAGLVCARFGVQTWTLAYTSRSGAPADPWLGPDVRDEIRAQARQGVNDMLAVPIGFVADHVEVLFDLDVEAQEAAREAGVAFRRARTVGDHPLFIRMIADVVKNPVPSPARGEGRRP
ncbi:MAG: ferrochelatase [Elusimicrobia bacterium RIFCSPLOWO2_01_FULL_59_12]|nr:MAG: ferrochelatase [Elusimicrobia bacterium RIFCSPLOWO2_01_FULL_59_12]